MLFYIYKNISLSEEASSFDLCPHNVSGPYIPWR